MDTFRDLYNTAQQFSLKGLTLEEQYDALGIADKFTLMTSIVQDSLVKLIMSALNPKDDKHITYYEIKNLRDAFYFSVKLFDKGNDWAFFAALHELHSLIGARMKRFAPFEDEDAWREALKYLKCYLEQYGTPHEEQMLIGMEEQVHRVAAIKALRKLDLRCTQDEKGDLQFTKKNVCLGELTRMIEAIGGVRFANQLLKMTQFDASKGRFIVPQPQSPDPREVRPSVPLAYLLNIAYRKTSSKGRDEALLKYWNDSIALATNICAAMYPVQSYFAMDDMFFDSPSEYMRKWAIYDSTLGMQQMSKKFCNDIMNYLIDRMLADGRCFVKGFTLEEYRSVMNEVLGFTKDKEFVRVKSSQITSVADAQHRGQILKKIAQEIVNPNYEDPLDYDKVNWSDKPAIGLPNGDMLLYPSSIGGLGWYEVLMTLLREQDVIKKAEIEAKAIATGKKKEKYVEIDNFVGYALEDFVKDKLMAKGINTKCGKYKVDGVVGECDVVVENGSKIILMELKKKNMTRMARQGYLYQIILDFAGSVLYSQEQAFRTETLLRRKSSLDLDDNGNHYSLDYNSRKCEKVTITLNEYGPLHERIIQQKVLDAFYRYSYQVNSSEIRSFIADTDKAEQTIKSYETLAKKRQALADYITALSGYKQMGPYLPFFDSWFFSIEQLCYLIDKCDNVDDFIGKFEKLKHISFSTKNFWSDVDLKLGLKP